MTTRALPAYTTTREEAAQARANAAERIGYQVRAQRMAQRAGALVAPESNARQTGGFSAQFRAPKKVQYNGQDMWHLTGIASVYKVRYEMWDMFGPYEELVLETAGDLTLKSNPDVVFLTNHRGLTMARTVAVAGKEPTLIVENRAVPEYDTTGLGMDAWLNPKRTDVADLVTAMDDGQVTEMSFAFMITQGWWSDDWMTFTIAEYDINRGDVSAVNYGANPYTSIAARQGELAQIVRDAPPATARALLTKLMQRTDLTNAARDQVVDIVARGELDMSVAEWANLLREDDAPAETAVADTPTTAAASTPARRGSTMSLAHAQAVYLIGSGEEDQT